MVLKYLFFLFFLAILALPAHADGVALNFTVNETYNVSTTGGVLVNALTPDGANLVLETNYLVPDVGAGWVIYWTRESCRNEWETANLVNRTFYNNQTNQTTTGIVREAIPPGTARFSRVLQSYGCQGSTTYFLPLNMQNNTEIANLTKSLYTVEPQGCGYMEKECKLVVTINREVEQRILKSYTPPIYITITKEQFDKFVKDRDLAMQESKNYMAETAGCKASMQEAKTQAANALQDTEKARVDLANERVVQDAKVASCRSDLNASVAFASQAFLNGTFQGYQNGYAIGSNQSSSQRFWQQVGLIGLVVGGIVFSYARYRRQRYYLPGVS